MKLRHAAVVAPALWYLIGPPQQGGPADFNVKAPVSQWKVIDRYDDISQCEQGRLSRQGEWYAKADADPAGSKNAINDAIMLIWLAESKCIASDDPGLKSK
jgi:hypothetical protein